MSPRSAFEEISYYRATAHITSVAVLSPPYQDTVQREIHSLLSRDTALIHNRKSKFICMF